VAFPARIKLASFVGAVAVLVLLAVSTISSQADARSNSERFAPSSPAIASAVAIAKSYWGTAPCNGQVTVEWLKQPADVNAVSTWSTTGTDPYGDPADNRDCVVDLNPDAQFSWPKLCTVIVHEFGHLNGHDHDPRPGRLMSALYTTPLPDCVTPQAKAAARGVVS
jgi:hypothetical protein